MDAKPRGVRVSVAPGVVGRGPGRVGIFDFSRAVYERKIQRL
jgi:hypothetical protein